MFCHWLVAEKNYRFRDVCYYKIAPGADARNWEACREGGFISMGWDEMGDLSGQPRKEFCKLRDELVVAQ